WRGAPKGLDASGASPSRAPEARRTGQRGSANCQRASEMRIAWHSSWGSFADWARGSRGEIAAFRRRFRSRPQTAVHRTGRSCVQFQFRQLRMGIMSRTESKMVELGTVAPMFEMLDVVNGESWGRDDVFAQSWDDDKS